MVVFIGFKSFGRVMMMAGETCNGGADEKSEEEKIDRSSRLLRDFIRRVRVSH